MDANEVDPDDEEGSDAEGDDDEADDDENEDDEDEESSADEVEDDDEELPPVDPAFRRKVAAALKSAGVGIDEDAEEEDEDDADEVDSDVWDDEQMDKVDEQLAAVFKERATTDKKTSSKRESIRLSPRTELIIRSPHGVVAFQDPHSRPL